MAQAGGNTGMPVSRRGWPLRRISAGTNISKSLRLPGWVDDAISHDRVAYPIHAALAVVLGRCGSSPAAAANEWLKAAAHARSAAALERATRGLIRAKHHLGREDLESILSTTVIGDTLQGTTVALMKGRQLMALQQAGLRYRLNALESTETEGPPDDPSSDRQCAP